MCCSAARDPATIARRGGVAGAGEHAAASADRILPSTVAPLLTVRPGLALN